MTAPGGVERRSTADRRRGTERREATERRAHYRREGDRRRGADRRDGDRRELETAGEDIRNALQLLAQLESLGTLDLEDRSDLSAAIVRLRIALVKLDTARS